MAGENLLDQRRARTRQAYDVNGTRFCVTCSLLLSEEIGGVKLTRALQSPFGFLGVVRHFLQPQRVAARVVAKRRREIASIFQCLAEREVKMHTVLVVEIATFERVLHRVDLCIAETKRLQIRKAPVRLAEIGIDLSAFRI